VKINENVYLVASGKMGFDLTHPSDCNVYLLASNGELALIDSGTGYSVDEICQSIQEYGFSLQQVTKIFLTHIHADHAGGAAQLRERTGAKVYVYEKAFQDLRDGDEDAIDLTTAKKFGFYPEDYQLVPCEADHQVKEGDVCKVGNLQVRVLETPGHSRYDISFMVEDGDGEILLFSGDTVFYNGKISMLHTQDFHVQTLAKSIAKLSAIDAGILLPGHYHFALKNGRSHIESAHQIFQSMGVPKNIVE